MIKTIIIFHIVIVDTIGSIDDLIEKYDSIFNKISLQISILYEKYNSSTVLANTLNIEILSTDYGKDKYEDGLQKCLIFRGTDIQSIKEGSSPDAPTRYITPKKLENKAIIENDILIEYYEKVYIYFSIYYIFNLYKK